MMTDEFYRNIDRKIIMKKLIAITLLIGCMAYPIIRPVFAAPGDVEITLVIPAAKVADFSAGFLAKVPIPMIEDPASTPENPLPNIPQYTAKQWIREWLRRQALRAYRHGKIKLAQDVAVVDPNAIQ